MFSYCAPITTRALKAFCFLLLIGILTGFYPLLAEQQVVENRAEETKVAGEGSAFLRFLEMPAEASARLQTSIASYQRKKGWISAKQQVDLISAIHIADPQYFDQLNEKFKEYDVVLFEMVGDADQLSKEALRKKNKGRKSTRGIGLMQRVMTMGLNLEYQRVSGKSRERLLCN